MKPASLNKAVEELIQLMRLRLLPSDTDAAEMI